MLFQEPAKTIVTIFIATIRLWARSYAFSAATNIDKPTF